MAQSNRQFVKFVRQHLAEYGMKLIIGRGKHVNVDGFRCSGYFDESGKAIAVAGKANEFMQVLVHEYCHFLQYINSAKIYTKSYEASTIVDAWLKGKNYPLKKVKRAFFIVRAMERDCERRAMKIIKDFNLAINSKMYAKRAHVYIYSHFLMEKTRKFHSYKRNPYYSKYVLKIMPSNMAVLSHKTIPPKVYSVLESFTI
jgi:hypothetical protein